MGRTIINGYKSYSFKDHDPVLDQIDRLIELSGSPKMTVIEAKSGVRASTLYNWHYRKTKRPQFATVLAVVRGLGARVRFEYQGKVIR